jgi:hypothetical protein
VSAPAAAPPKPLWTRLVQAVVLVSLFGLLYGATRLVPGLEGAAGTIVEVVSLPHLSGYLLAGVVAGPHVLGFIDHHAVEELTTVNTLALALIAMEGGAELRVAEIKKGLRSLGWAMLFQSTVVLVAMTAVFVSARPLIPFLKPLGVGALLGVALLWATLAVSRSPSATLGILSQTRARGPIATGTLTFVMSSDVVVVLLMAGILMIVRPLIEPMSSFSLRELKVLGYELVGSVALGTTLGIVLAVYMRLVGKQLILLFVALGFGLSEMLRYLRFDALLTFMVAGFVVQNLSKQGEAFIRTTREMASVVFVVFFATAGAHLDVPLLKKLWPVALLLAGTRTFFTYIASRLASRMAEDPPILKKWAWAGLISQAGLTLGMLTVIERAFPSLGTGFRSLAIATIAVNEMVGPVLFKLALDRGGETVKGSSPPLAPDEEQHPPVEGHA